MVMHIICFWEVGILVLTDYSTKKLLRLASTLKIVFVTNALYLDLARSISWLALSAALF